LFGKIISQLFFSEKIEEKQQFYGKMTEISPKSSCKTYFFICILEKITVSLLLLTKQHNLFYTLKKLIPINAVLCEKCRGFFIHIRRYKSGKSKSVLNYKCNPFQPQGFQGLATTTIL